MTIDEFKTHVREELKAAANTYQQAIGKKSVDVDMWFGYVDALRDVLVWAKDLEE